MLDKSGNNLSIVVSGPILGTDSNENEYTMKACEAARIFFPKAEIVVSTWKESNVEGLDYDILVQSDDPGPNRGNVNRQICSRRAGVLKASRKYVLAIRSESEIKRTDFTNYLDKFESHGSNFQFLKHRIVIPAAYPACRGEYFHLGDWYFLGYKEDILNFWDLPYMDDSKYNNTEDDLLYNPHRYLVTEFTRKYYPLEFYKKKDITEENKTIYEKIIAENFVVTGFYEYGIESLKYPLSHKFMNKLFHKEVGYTFSEWKELYNKYSGGNEVIRKNLAEKLMINVCVPLKRSRFGSFILKIRRRLFNLNYWE